MTHPHHHDDDRVILQQERKDPWVVTEEDLREGGAIAPPDQIDITSVGIDIGSATSHMSIARIMLRRMGKALSSRYVTVSRDTVFESDILLTPYTDEGLIDAEQLDAFIVGCFTDAQIAPDDIDTGAVILTGEALRRKNARAIGQLFEDHAGRFVCATAGDVFESTMAAHGSGAVEMSRSGHNRVLNIDIGGGTTKISVCENGDIVDRGVLHVGARLLATTDDGRIERYEDACRSVAEDIGLELATGSVAGEAEKAAIAARMVESVDAFLGLAPADDLMAKLSITDPMHVADIDTVIFSSGVAEYVYGDEQTDRGDLAAFIAAEMRRRIDDGTWPWPVADKSTGIRATVAGVSQYTVQMSGDTIRVTGEDTLPWRNMRLVRVEVGADELEEVTERMQRAYDELALSTTDGGFAWYFDVFPSRRYKALRTLAEGIEKGLEIVAGRGLPHAILFEDDIAGSIGHILVDELGVDSDIAVIDCIAGESVDFIDVGNIIEPNSVVPVIVKTLLF